MNLLTKWSFKNKAAVGLLVVISLVIGALSYFLLPMEFLPEADNPQVTVTAIGPGYDSKSMESSVTTPLENALSGVKGKSEMLSTSGDGYSKIDMFFESKTDMKEAKQEVQEAVAQVQLPERVMKPFVLQLNTNMIPVSEVSIAFKEGLSDQERDKLEKEVLSELEKVDGMGNVTVGGKVSPSVSVKADPAKLAQAGVSPQVLMGVLQGRNTSASIGEKTIDGTTGNLKVTSSVESLDVLRNLAIVPGVKLQDVAEVGIRKQQESVNRVNEKEVIFASMTKEGNANSVKVAKGIQKAIDDLNEKHDQLELNVFYSSADMVVHSVSSMMREVLMGALFATIVILLFLRNFRATLITVVSIPLSLAITLYLLNISGVTLNIITLGGVAVAVGRLVDDSIVVIENIYRRMQKEPFSGSMIIEATKEVSAAITSSTITTVAVFLPMGLLRGALQSFLLPFALTLTYSLLASLLVALTVVPLLGSVLLRNTKVREHQPSQRFSRFLRWNLQHKWVTLILAGLVFMGSIGAYVTMPKAALDSSDATFVSASLSFPSDTPVSKVIEEGKKLEKFMIDQGQAKYVLMQNGNSSDAAKWGNVSPPTLVSFAAVMKEDADAEVFMESIKSQKDKFPGADLSTGRLDLMGSSSTSVTIDLIGDDMTTLTKLSGELMEKIKSVEGVLKTESNQQATKPVFSFQVDPSAANAQEIAMQLQSMLNPMPIGEISLDNRKAAVFLEPLVNPASTSDLNNVVIGTHAGPVPVSSVAKLVKTDEPSMSYHKDGKAFIRIMAMAEASKLSVVGQEIKKITDEFTLPNNVSLVTGGASAQQSSDFADLGMTALISIALVYLIMVITFKTLRAPLAILFSLPLAAIGAVIGLIISGISPDFTAAFGALMLVGIVVTNAIVLIDRVRHNEQHMPIREALVEAAATRMRPILMTAIATICAMLPLVYAKAEMGSIVSKSLAIVVIGGLTAATLLTLIVVPCVYELFFWRKSRRQRKEAKAAAANAAAPAASAPAGV